MRLTKENVGDKFNRLTLIGLKPSKWRCDCGNEFTHSRPSVIAKGLIQSCGCLRKENAANLSKERGERKRRKKGITPGQTHGFLTIIEQVKSQGRDALFRAKCECGAEIIRPAKGFHPNSSCGCKRREVAVRALSIARDAQRKIYETKFHSMWRGLFGTPRHIATKLGQKRRIISLAGDE